MADRIMIMYVMCSCSSLVHECVLCVCVKQETDYIMSYFDNGEDFGADSDDNMDEAVY